jgi:hypothetical protein
MDSVKTRGESGDVFLRGADRTTSQIFIVFAVVFGIKVFFFRFAEELDPEQK